MALRVVVILVVAVLASSIRVVPEFMRLVVFRLGRLVGVRGPGLVFDQEFPVDREQVIDIAKRTCITKDNAAVDVELLIYGRLALCRNRVAHGGVGLPPEPG